MAAAVSLSPNQLLATGVQSSDSIQPMRHTLKLLASTTLAVAFLAGTPAILAAPQDKVEHRASAGISVSNRNGDVTVTWKGKVVFTGKATGRVSGKASNENGTEFAAAFDDDKVIWENVPGAGEKLKNR